MSTLRPFLLPLPFLLLLPVALFTAPDALGLDLALRHGPGHCAVSNVANAVPAPVLTCSNSPGWVSAQLIRVVNVVKTAPIEYSPVSSRNWYVRPLTANTFGLYADAGLKTPAPNPGAYLPANGSVRWAGAVKTYTMDETRPRLWLRKTTQSWRCEAPCLQKVVVEGGTATATIPGGHRFRPGGGVGLWGFSQAALNRTDRVVSAVTATTVQWPEPDAPAGVYTDGMISERAHNLNPVGWQRIVETCSSFTSYAVLSAEVTGERNLACALKYFVDRSDKAALARATFVIDHPIDLAYGTVTCDETTQYCNGRDDAVDYVRGFTTNGLKVYDLLVAAGALTAEQRASFRAKVLTDRSTDPGCVNQQSTYPAGSVKLSGATLTGTGTDFTKLAVEGAIWLVPNTIGPPLSYGVQIRDDAFIFRIVSIQSPTQLTLNREGSGTYAQSTSVNSAGWKYNRPWRNGDCGLRFLANHHNVSILSDPAIYPPQSGMTDDVFFTNNLAITSAANFISMGIAFAGEDTRADNMLMDAWAVYWDHQMSGNMSHLASGHPMGTSYRHGRGPLNSRAAVWITTAFPTYPRTIGAWLNGTVRLAPYTFNGGSFNTDRSFFGQTGEDAPFISPYAIAATAAEAELPSLSETDRRAYQTMLISYCGGKLTSACFGWHGGRGAPHLFEGFDPQLPPIDLNTLPLGQHNAETSRELCAGGAYCRPNKIYIEAVSRKNWAYDETAVNLHVGSGTNDQDHETNMADAWWVRAGSFNGHQIHFIGTDDYDGAVYAQEARKNHVRLSAHPTERHTGSNANTLLNTIVPALFHVRVNAGPALLPEPRRLHRDYLRFLPGSGAGVVDDIIIVRTDAAANAGRIQSFTHYTQNGQSATEGNTTCGGAVCPVGTPIAGNIHSQSLTHRSISNAVYPDPARRGIRRIEGANGAYAGGAGFTFRKETCASADGVTCSTSATGLLEIEVHKIGALADSTTLASIPLTAGAWDGVQTTGSNSTVIAMFATVMQTAMPPVITNRTARFAAIGLAPGNYDVRRNGEVVCNDLKVAPAEGSVYCPSVEAGSIDIVFDGPPPPSPPAARPAITPPAAPSPKPVAAPPKTVAPRRPAARKAR